MKAQMFNFHFWVSETDPEKLKAYFDDLLRRSGFGIVAFAEYNFDPPGFSCAWIISESHLCIHTWPEEGKSAVDLGSCNYEKYLQFRELLDWTMTVAVDYEDS